MRARLANSAAFAHLRRSQPYDRYMATVLWILIIAWVVLAIVGFAIEGLLWLAVIGIVLFIGTVVFGFIRNRAGRSAT